MAQERYQRQILLPQIGPAGQERIARARVLLVGCGALGSVLAEQLARAGVGHLVLLDRDIVEWTNLQRQVLFDEADARDGMPKAAAAARRLAAINSEIVIQPMVLDLNEVNIESAIGDIKPDVVLDGTDNVQTRYLLNDVCVKLSLPWIYGACVGTEGRVMAIRPGWTACLRCIFPTPPVASELATCDTAGVLGPAAAIVASFQATAAIKLLSGNDVGEEMLTIDVWRGRVKAVETSSARSTECLCCGKRNFEFLNAAPRESAVSLCGRDAVQVRGREGKVDLASMAERWRDAGKVTHNPWFVRCQLKDPAIVLTLFPDGRAIVQGTCDLARARSVYARFVGA